MSQSGETFATAVGCMDGRTEIPIEEYALKRFGVVYVDNITEAGLVGMLAMGQMNKIVESSLENKLAISIGNHHAKGIVVHGHQECAGNPVEDTIHKEHIVKSVAIIKDLVRNEVSVVGVFVVRSSQSPHGWEVQEV